MTFEKRVDIALEARETLLAQKKALEDQIKGLEDSIKQEMEKQGIDELHTENFVVRYKGVESQRFDKDRFIKVYGELGYKSCCSPSFCMRFTVMR